MPGHTRNVIMRIQRRWMQFWGLVFFLGILINFTEIVCRTFFHFSIDLMYDLPIWLTIWAVMMLAGPILMTEEHVSVDMIRTAVHGRLRKGIEIVNCLAVIFFGAIVTYSGYVFISQCIKLHMKIIRCVSVPRWIVETCIPVGMAIFTLYGIALLVRVLRTSYTKTSPQDERTDQDAPFTE